MNQDKIVIMGDQAMHIREQVVKATSIEELVRELRNRTTIDTPVLPRGTISYSQNGRAKIIFVQRPEKKLFCRYYEKYFEIAWPWHLIGLIVDGNVVQSASLFFSNGPVETDTETIFQPPVPNQEDNGRMCLGATYVKDLKGANGLGDIADKTFEYIYGSKYNHDLSGCLRFIPEDFKKILGKTDLNIEDIFKAWQEWTKVAGDDWSKKLKEIKWHTRDTFANIRRRFRS